MSTIPRETLLKYQTISESDRIPLVLTYHPYLRPINKIAKNLPPLLNKDPPINKIFPAPPLISLYRQAPNLKLLLTSASLPNKTFITGTFPCKCLPQHKYYFNYNRSQRSLNKNLWKF